VYSEGLIPTKDGFASVVCYACVLACLGVYV
jgi:hypothetical protein